MHTSNKFYSLILAGDWALQGRNVGKLNLTSSLIFNLEGPINFSKINKKKLNSKVGSLLSNQSLPEIDNISG